MRAPSTNLDPERLRHITRRFQYLQSGGLILVVMGAVFFFFEASEVFPDRRVGDSFGVLILVLWLVANRYIPKYYERRFGRIEPAEISLRSFVVLMLTILAALLIATTMRQSAHVFFEDLNNQLHVLISDPDHLVNFGPLVYWALLLIMAPRPVDRGKLRWLPTILLPFWSIVFLCPLYDPAVTHVVAWKVVSSGWLGLSLMIIGLYDHFALVRLLPKRPQGEREI